MELVRKGVNYTRDIEVISVSCRLFVPLALEGWFDDEILQRGERLSGFSLNHTEFVDIG